MTAKARSRDVNHLLQRPAGTMQPIYTATRLYAICAIDTTLMRVRCEQCSRTRAGLEKYQADHRPQKLLLIVYLTSAASQGSIVLPVVCEEMPEARKTMTAATSSGVATRPVGYIESSVLIPTSLTMYSTRSVRTKLGAAPYARMLSLAARFLQWID